MGIDGKRYNLDRISEDDLNEWIERDNGDICIDIAEIEKHYPQIGKSIANLGSSMLREIEEFRNDIEFRNVATDDEVMCISERALGSFMNRLSDNVKVSSIIEKGIDEMISERLK